MADTEQEERPDEGGNGLLIAAGTNLRNALVTFYVSHGTKVGFKVAQRYAWEIADIVAQFHSAEDASGLMFAAGDAVLSPDRLDAIRRLGLRSPRPADFPDEGVT